jgi:hypothetical protein
MPMVLGALADAMGLQRACLLLPALTAASGLCFAAARTLERRGRTQKAGTPARETLRS